MKFHPDHPTPEFHQLFIKRQMLLRLGQSLWNCNFLSCDTCVSPLASSEMHEIFRLIFLRLLDVSLEISY